MNRTSMLMIVLFLVGSIGGAKADEKATTDDKEKAVGMVLAFAKDDSSTSTDKAKVGTAFLVKLDKSGVWMVTCAHVVNKADAIRINFSKTEYALVEEVYLDEAHDQALLKLEESEDSRVPHGVVPFSIREKDLPGDLKGKRIFQMVGFIRGAGPDPQTVSAEVSQNLSGKFIGLSPEDQKKLDLRMEAFQVVVPGEPGASGSPIIDSDDRVVGVYMARGAGPSDIGYASSWRYIKNLPNAKIKVPMNRDRREKLKRFKDFDALQLKLLMDAATRTARGNAPLSTIPWEQIPKADVFARFFATKNKECDEPKKKWIEATIGRSDDKLNHVVNTDIGVGFLVPKGYELTEKINEDKGHTLTVSRESSHYKVRFYSRRTQALANELEKEADEFEQESKLFMTDVLNIAVVQGNTTNQPREAVVAPGSWPSIYRASDNDLITFRAFSEPAKGLVHSYMFGYNRSARRFEVYGMSFPLAAYRNEPTDEYKELDFILHSAYDFDLGIKLSREKCEEEALKAVRNLSTPNGVPNGFPQDLQRTFPAVPGTGAPRPPQGNGPNGGVLGGIPQQMPGKPGANPAPKPQPVKEFFAPNLGIHYQLVKFPNGRIGARLTRDPKPGSPAANLSFGNGLGGWLETGDTILFLDGLPIQNAGDPLDHFDWTVIDFINVNTNRMVRAKTFIP